MVDRSIPRHERVDARLWDQKIQRWKPLLPFGSLSLPGGSDLGISQGSITLAGDHPCAPELARVRAGIPALVSIAVNGVEWSGQITDAVLQSEAGMAPVWVCKVESDGKHAHRMLSRDTAVSAADMTATRLQGWLGEVFRRLVASNAQRTGLPIYILVEGEGDPVDVEARTEDSVYDVLQDVIVGSRMHVEVRMLRPDHDLPGVGVVEHYAGQMERAWEQHELDNGAWPHAQTHARIVGKAAPHPELMLPQHSWRGQGTIDVYGEPLLYPEAGICWAPFETLAEAPADYYTTINPEGIRIANEQELRILQDNQFMGWSQHVTMWENWQTVAQPETLSPNLLLDSGGITLTGSDTETLVTLDESAGDKTTINITGAGSNPWNAYTWTQSRITDEDYFTTPGETFTLSVDVRADLPQDVTARFSFDVRNPRHNSTVTPFRDTGGQWVRISSTITIPSGDPRSQMLIVFYEGSGNLDVGTIEVRRFKLERGAVATAWTRAPEEVELPGTDLAHLRGAVEAGLVATIDGTVFEDLFDVDTYVDGDDVMFAWRDGTRWVLANQQDFDVEHEKRQPRGATQRQTPGVLFHLYPERDRRGVVFSSTPGGGLEAWSVAHTAPDAAMIVAGGQVDERTLAAAKAGIMPPSALGSYTPEEAQGVLPSGSVVPGTIDRLDVDAQPLAAIEGTEVSYSSAGGKVDLAMVGPFFYREKYLSLSSSGGGDPLHDMTKAWSQAQGMSTMSLTPGASTSVMFGDDVTREDGTIIPGWRPGDRVSFVDRQTRISEVVSGYRLEAENGRVVSVVPTLGRQERGVYADLAKRLRDAERRATKAQLAPPRRLPEQELIAAAAKEAAEQMLVEQEIRNAAIQQQNAAQFALHDNQLKWLSWTEHVYDFRFSLASGSSTRPGNEISTGLIDVKLNSSSGMGYEITIRPGWRGVWRFEWMQEGGDGATGAQTGEEGGARTTAVAYIYETDKVIRMGSLYIWPEHSPSPREWVVQVVPDGTGTARFVAPATTSGNLTISGAPGQQENGAIVFETPVVADSDVRVGNSGTGTVYPSGEELAAGWYLRPLVDGDVGVVRFTEVKPALTWEAGAPLTGRQRIPIASQTVPRSTWVTLAEWTGLDWPSPRTATITYEVQWASYNAWALADYYTRVTLNGQQIGYIARGTTGGMDAYFKMVLSGRTLAAGDVLKFEARATPGFVSERKISSASAEIVW